MKCTPCFACKITGVSKEATFLLQRSHVHFVLVREVHGSYSFTYPCFACKITGVSIARTYVLVLTPVILQAKQGVYFVLVQASAYFFATDFLTFLYTIVLITCVTCLPCAEHSPSCLYEHSPSCFFTNLRFVKKQEGESNQGVHFVLVQIFDL